MYSERLTFSSHPGLIKSNLNPTLKFSPPQTIVLSVNVTELEVTQYLGFLTWYFEGDPILMGGRVTLSPDRTSLTITNTVESDAGIYEVKHMGLLISQRQEKCESRVLDALRNYPILSGIRFTVNNTLSGNVLMWLATQHTIINVNNI